MINVGYPSRTIKNESLDFELNEKLQGELADALKQTSPSSKTNLINGLRALDIDFSRSIDKAVLVKSARDARLKDPDNVVIGVFKGARDQKLRIVAYQPKVGPVSETKNIIVEKPNGETEKIANFGDLSWTRWLGIMSSVYVINKNDASKLSQLDRGKKKERRKT